MSHNTGAAVWCLIFVVTVTISLAYGINPHRRFEYKQSFKGPHLVQRDGSIPFWTHGGHAIASEESIRITPSLRSKKGHVWCNEPNPHANWEIEVSFRVSGRGRVGADGLAVWYTAQQSLSGGPVFGAADKWNGLGVFFDSFDNDNQKNNPYIMAMVNDGTKEYNHGTDGSTQQLAGCLRDFRNKPFPVRAKIEYYQGSLQVSFHNGMTNNPNDFELCLRVGDIKLPENGYFGVSAATGGLADDHDVQSFITHSLTPQQDAPAGGEVVPEEERKKFQQEFDDYWEKLQKAKEEFKQENPDKNFGEYDDSNFFEAQDQRELKQIFDGQAQIHMTVRDLNNKLDGILGRQEQTLSTLTIMQGQKQPVGGQQQQQGGGAAQIGADVIRRHEVDTLLTNQRELVQNLRELRNTVSDVNTRTHNLQTQISTSAGQQGGKVVDNSYQFTEIKDTLNNLNNDVRTLASKPQGSMNCPPPADVSCVSSFHFMAFGLFQVALIIGYMMYRSSKEAAAKKFY